MIVFENDGVLDIRAVKTFGVSSKEDRSTAIGYFGTGLKYAIAILLRNGHRIGIITGGKAYQFGVSTSRIRNDNFDIVTMNDQELGFTTELGKDWELWQAFRELYSNMLDEKGTASCVPMLPGMDDSRTYIWVDGRDFENVFRDKDKYFLPETVPSIAGNSTVCALEKNTTIIGDPALLYYRGIRVSTSMLPGLYDYNFTKALTLTEDRTIANGYSVNYQIAAMVASSDNEDFIRRVVTAEMCHEAQLDFMSMASPGNVDVFLSVVGQLRKRHKDVGINPSAIRFHKKHTKVETVLPRTSVPLTTVEQQQLDRATAFCRDTLKLEDIEDFQTIVVQDLGKGHLGRADMDKGIMYVSKQCFKEGTKRVAVCLLEEYTHCKHQVLDETVEQKWVYLNMITTLGEQITGEPL